MIKWSRSAKSDIGVFLENITLSISHWLQLGALSKSSLKWKGNKLFFVQNVDLANSWSLIEVNLAGFLLPRIKMTLNHSSGGNYKKLIISPLMIFAKEKGIAFYCYKYSRRYASMSNSMGMGRFEETKSRSTCPLIVQIWKIFYPLLKLMPKSEIKWVSCPAQHAKYPNCSSS